MTESNSCFVLPNGYQDYVSRCVAAQAHRVRVHLLYEMAMGKLTEIPATFEDGQGTNTDTCQSNSIIGFKKNTRGSLYLETECFQMRTILQSHMVFIHPAVSHL